MTDYLQKILRARVYDVARETPLDPAPNLSQRLNNRVWLKREDLQPVFSFKLRGAYNRMVQLPVEDLQRGVIASSAGNHAQGVALSARRLGCRSVIVMPKTTPEVKIRAVRALGGEVVLHGETYDECSAEAQKRCEAEGLTYIHPFDDPEVIAGQGTIGMEIMRQSKEPPDAIYVAVGGGGLIAGISAYVKQLWPETEVIGVEPVDADAKSHCPDARQSDPLRGEPHVNCWGPPLIRERLFNSLQFSSARAAGTTTSRYAASASVSTGSRSATLTMSAPAARNAAICSTASSGVPVNAPAVTRSAMSGPH